MYTGLLHLHNFLRWVIIILLFVNIVRLMMSSGKPFVAADKKYSLFLMIAAHLTLLLGLYQYFFGGNGFAYFQNFGAAEVMKNGVYRYWAVEHITSMIIAIVLITIGHITLKRSTSDSTKKRRAMFLFIAALLVIFIMAPWPFREVGIARPLLPKMPR